MTEGQPVYRCNWPECSAEVRGKRWACEHHWQYLPFDLRSRVFEVYVPGEERNAYYLAVLDEIRRYIKDRNQLAVSIAAMKAEYEQQTLYGEP